MAQPQQQQQQNTQRHVSDHDGGDLAPCVEELSKLCVIPDIGITSVEEILGKYKEQAATALETFDRFIDAAKKASMLNDAAADQWKTKGNDDFSKGDGDIAAIHYTKGLTLAQSDDTVALLLNNRATVYLSQKRMRDAMIDSHLAFSLKPDYWKALMRRGRCLVELGFRELGERDLKAGEAQCAADANSDADLEKALQRPFPGPFAPPPTYTLADHLQVQRDGKGRHVVATKKLDPQTILLESPYAVAPRGEGLFTACSHCMHRTAALYPSPHFRRANAKSRGLFCSMKCADNHWALYGEREVSNPFYLLCSVDTLLALRMLQTTFEKSTRAHHNEDEEGTTTTTTTPPSSSSCSQEVFDPMTDNRFGRDHMDLMIGFSKETAPFAEVGGKESVIAALALRAGVVDARSAEKLRKGLRQVLSNAFAISCIDRIISNSESHSFVSVTVGKGLYAVASLFNHSCDPNCFVSFRGNPHASSGQLCIRLLRPVMEGEEVTIAYAGIDKTKVHSTRGRIRALRGAYGFACCCNVCRNVVDEVIRKEDEAHYMKAADYYQKGRRLTREGNFEEAINVLFQSYEIVMRYICPPPRPPQMMLPKTHDALAHAYLLSGNRDKCVEHLKESLRLNVELNGGEYPDLIREYTRLAMLGNDDIMRKKVVELLDRYYCPSEFLEAEKAYVSSAAA